MIVMEEVFEQAEADKLEDSIRWKKEQIYTLTASILKDALKLKNDFGYSKETLKKLVEL